MTCGRSRASSTSSGQILDVGLEPSRASVDPPRAPLGDPQPSWLGTGRASATSTRPAQGTTPQPPHHQGQRANARPRPHRRRRPSRRGRCAGGSVRGGRRRRPASGCWRTSASCWRPLDEHEEVYERKLGNLTARQNAGVERALADVGRRSSRRRGGPSTAADALAEIERALANDDRDADRRAGPRRAAACCPRWPASSTNRSRRRRLPGRAA